jgi:hypothetical protein
MRNKILWDISAGVLMDGILIPHSLPEFLGSILKTDRFSLHSHHLKTPLP